MISQALIFETNYNQAIQEHLKPNVIRTPINEGQLNTERSQIQIGDKTVNTRFLNERKEVIFNTKISITKYFDSTIKCLRINQPTVIHIENQGMTDEHCIKLCNFLKLKGMINELNLR